MQRDMLEGKVALVTGSGRGIGKAIAKTLANHGASVIVCARSEPELAIVAEEIRQMHGECLPVVADLTNDEAIKNLFKAASNAFSHLDILINNAGASTEKPFMELTNEDFLWQYDVNLMSVVRCTRAVLPMMLENGKGSIINISSGAGLRGLSGNSAYAASKAAVIALTHSIAEELKATSIRANVICPGPVETQMYQKSAIRDALVSLQPRALTPEEIAGIVLFLASDYSMGLNSQVFNGRLSNRW